MAKKPSKDPTTREDLIEYLDEKSGLSFELQVLKLLSSFGFACQHGGSYKDPVKGIARQFEIRATGVIGPGKIHLAVECKRLQPSFPLLVLSVSRQSHEAFHELVILGPRAIRVEDWDAIYHAGKPVGRETVQVSRSSTKTDSPIRGELIHEDREVFEKWAQAISSAHGLVDLAVEEHRPSAGHELRASLVLPVLVVPDSTLWEVRYQNHPPFERTDPAPAQRCSFVIGHRIDSRGAANPVRYTLSHLEIVTPPGLERLIDELNLLSNWGPTHES